MKKSLHFFFIPVIVLFIAAYFYYADAVKSFVFTQVQKFSTADVSMKKVIFLDDKFTVGEYGAFLDRMKTLDNSVALFLPQVYNVKVEEYLDNMDLESMKARKDAYRELTLKLSESQNVIPVVFAGRGTKNKLKHDMSGFSYFKSADIDMRLVEYDTVKVMSDRAWYMIGGAGFYEEYYYLPFTIPAIMKFGDSVLAGAAVEAIRRYYKFTRTKVGYMDGRLKIGDVIDFPLLKNGDIIIHRLKDKPKVYALSEFMKAENSALNDRIVIVKTKDISQSTMFSLGIMTASIMEGKYIKYDPFMNYAGAFIILLGLIAAYRSLRLMHGAMVFAGTGAIFFVICVLFMTNNIYLDFALLFALNLLVFITIYYYRITSLLIDRGVRQRVLSQFMHPKTIKKFILRNKDIKIKNTWLKTFAIYINFEEDGEPDAAGIKKTFEKARELIYNRHKDFIIKGHNNCDMAIVILDDSPDAKRVIGTALEIREKLSEMKFNVILNDTEVYIFENKSELGILDKNYAVRRASETLEKKKYIIIPEADVQKYINLIKFQKIAGTGGVVLFNITGFREEQN